MVTYAGWLADGKPVRFARPIAQVRDVLRAHGYTVYDIGNQGHLTHQPPEDHTPYSATGWPIPAPYPYVNAIDIMPPPAGSGLPSLQAMAAQIRADKMAGHIGAEFVKYMNWEPEQDNGGPCYHDSWMPTYARRTSGDRGHIHISGRSDTIGSTHSDDYDPVARIMEGADMPLSGDADKAFIQDAIRDMQIVVNASSAPLFSPGRNTAGVTEFWALAPIHAQRASVAAALANTAIADLTTLVLSQSDATAEDIAAVLAPLINAQIGDAASPAEVEQALINVLRGGTDQAPVPTA